LEVEAMTTGYTNPVAEGRHTTIEQYAWHCSEAFFYDGNATAGDTEFESHEVKKAEAELERLCKLSKDEMSIEWAKELARIREANQASWKHHHDMLARYTAMLEKVRAWELPTARHSALKTFMESQLVDSIKHDCDGEPFVQRSPAGSAEGWRSVQISRATQALASAQEEYAKEQARFMARKTYLDALTAALGPRPVRTP
jgi:hypothetical protein